MIRATIESVVIPTNGMTRFAAPSQGNVFLLDKGSPRYKRFDSSMNSSFSSCARRASSSSSSRNVGSHFRSFSVSLTGAPWMTPVYAGIYFPLGTFGGFFWVLPPRIRFFAARLPGITHLLPEPQAIHDRGSRVARLDPTDAA